MKKLLVTLVILFIVLFSISFDFANEKKIKVGYYDDYPLIYKDKNGKPNGFAIDIISRLLENENYQLEYVYGTWANMLDFLKNDEIDLIVDILKSEKRDEIYDFNEKPLLLSWGKICVNTAYNIESIFDLEGLKIGYLDEDYYVVEKNGLKDIIKDFNLNVKFYAYPTYYDVFKAVESNEVNVGVINKLTINEMYNYKNIKDTPIIFAATGLRVATLEGKNKEILDIVDKYLGEWKNDENSYYYELYDQYFKSIDNKVKAFYYENKNKILLTLFIVLFIIIYSRIELYYKIKELKKINIKLSVVNKKNDANYKEVEKTYEDSNLLINKFEKLVKFLSKNLGIMHKGSEEYFMCELLAQSINLVSEADYGFVYYFDKDELLVVIDAINMIRPDFRKINKNDLLFIDKKVMIIENFTLKLINMIERKDVINEIKKEIPVSKESLLLMIEKENKVFGGILLEIKKDSKKSFTIESERVMTALKNIAESYFLNQSYHKTDEVFQKEIIFSMVEMLEIHDIYTSGHSGSVANYSKLLAKYIEMDDKTVDRIYWAGLVHDIGKILISKDVINKKGKLTNGEYEEIKKHPTFGYKALSKSKVTEDIAKIVLYHHERIDGLGYPNGLKANEIPIESKIIAIADSYDAMISKRSYKESITKEEALEEIKNNLNKQFDYELGLKFIEMMEGRDL